MVKECPGSFAKFDESVEVIAMNLGVDPKHADQIVRGTVASCPHGTGKEVRFVSS